MDLLLKNIGLLATPLGTSARKGAAQGEILLQKNAAVGIKNGRIVFAGIEDATLRAAETLDCGGRLVTPGLVDAHTHLVFGGWRQHEMAEKLAGVPYLDILRGGGGILSTVNATREATEDELLNKSEKLLREARSFGVTTCEIKSGYGLNAETELKQLRVVRRLQGLGLMDIVPTFMGAHAVPAEYKNDREGYIRLVCEKMLPKIAEEKLAEYCDIFCETAVFTPEETARILGAAKKLGLGLKLHGDEIDPIGCAGLAARLGCVSAEHLIQSSDDGIRAMAKAGVTAVLLPATSFYLDKPYARARTMIGEGVAVAVATDFNPGSCPSVNLQLCMSLACLKYRMTPAEALTAVTLNAAAAIGRAGNAGSVEPGKQADLVIWDTEDLDYIFYRFGSNLAATVIYNGQLSIA